jgi:hypothetical protein
MKKFKITIEEIVDENKDKKYPETVVIYTQNFESVLDKPIESIIKAVNNI